jgi:hypothetical protein
VSVQVKASRSHAAQHLITTRIIERLASLFQMNPHLKKRRNTMENYIKPVADYDNAEEMIQSHQKVAKHQDNACGGTSSTCNAYDIDE